MSAAGWLTLACLGLPWLGALGVWAAGERWPRARVWAAVGFSAAGGVAALALLGFRTEAVTLRLPISGATGELTFAPDGLGALLAAIASGVGWLTVLYSAAYMRGEAGLSCYYALVLLFIGAMNGLVLTSSLFALFVFWEITALCSYALIAFHNDDPRAVAGGLKALILTQFGGLGLLAGVLAVYAQLGTFQYAALLAGAATIPAGALAFVAFGFLTAAAAKSAQAPLHTWLPDAMEAPTPVSALIHAATMVNAGVYLLARFYPAFAGVPGWREAVVGVGVASALLAALMALVATDLKRVLAFSTISQLGYMVYAVGVGAIFASQFHLLSHAVFKALLFLAAGAVIHATGSRDLRRMGGLGRQMPYVRNVFVLGALALAGLPMLNGFFSKELLLEAGLAHGPGWAFALMLAGAGLTALYTARMVWLVFFGAARERLAHSTALPLAESVALGALALGTLTSWLLAGPLSAALAATLPWHALHRETTLALAHDIAVAPATYLTLAVVATGIAAWAGRRRLAGLTRRASWLARVAEAGFGFEWANQQVVGAARWIAEAVRGTQTGQLNWNMAGVVGGLVIVLALLAWGGAP